MQIPNHPDPLESPRTEPGTCVFTGLPSDSDARHRLLDLLGVQAAHGAHLALRCWPLLPGQSCLQRTYTCPLFKSFQLWGGPAIMWQASSREKIPSLSLLAKNKNSRKARVAPRVLLLTTILTMTTGTNTSIFSQRIIDPRQSSLGFLQIPQSSQFLTLSRHQNHLVNFYKIRLTALWNLTQRFKFSGLGYRPGTPCFKGCPGDSDVQPQLRTNAPS